ncbi:hypothetical protein ACG04R_23505 [Roseateles sp. BYS78W]|uniref:PEP-CTERM sorting domain-containing protein n=1 Tax=Pelomonas candidula TaxID=3299025 RepID=A0ABW7HJ16_9BURK
MKALILAAALAALSSTAFAGAARETATKADTATVAVMTGADHLSSTSLSSLNDGRPWTDAGRSGSEGANFSGVANEIEPGYLLVALCVLGFALSRPVVRLLRRQEQQRRATALASTLGHQPRS